MRVGRGGKGDETQGREIDILDTNESMRLEGEFKRRPGHPWSCTKPWSKHPILPMTMVMAQRSKVC